MKPAELKQLRKAKGMTQNELASFLGVSYSAVTKWETEQNPIPNWVEEKMRDRRKGLNIDGLSADELAEMEKRAAQRGMTTDDLAADMIRAFLKLSVLVAVAWSI